MLALLCAGRAAADSLPEGQLPDYFVALNVSASPLEGLRTAFPVELREVRPMGPEEAAELDHLKPDGYSWTFRHGFGQLESDGDRTPVRTFVLRVPPSSTSRVKTRLRASIPSTYRTTAFTVQLENIALAVVGPKSRDLRALFPVPFAAQPPGLGSQIELLAVQSGYPKPLTAASTWKFDLGGQMIARALVDRQILYRPTDVLADARLGPTLAQTPPYSALMASYPLALENLETRVYAASFLFPKSVPEVVESAVSTLIEQKPAFLFQPVIWTGGIPSPSGKPWAIDLASDVAAAATSSSAKAYDVQFLRAAGGGGLVGFDGFALPESGSDNVQVFVSALSCASFAQLGASLLRQLVRGWRWRQIMIAPAAPLTQSLLRMNEPLWDYIVGKTVEGSYASTIQGETDREESLDYVELKILDDLIGLPRAAATDPEFALAQVRERLPRGTADDSFHPLPERVDHLLCKAIVTALDGGGGQYAAASSSSALNLVAKWRDSKQKDFAQEIADLVAAGFTRPAWQVPLAAGRDAVGRPRSGVTSPTREPDLVWLARALTTQSGAASPLERPFASLEGTRLQRAVSHLVGRDLVTSIVWDGPPALPEGAGFIVVDKESLPALRDLVIYAKRKFSDDGAKSRRVSLATSGAAEGWSDAWWNRFSASLSPAATSGDVTSYRYHASAHKIDRIVSEIESALTSVTFDATKVTETGSVAYTRPATVDASENSAAILVLSVSPSGIASGFADATPAGPTPFGRKVLEGIHACGEMIALLAPAGKGPSERTRYYEKRVAPALSKPDRLSREVWTNFLIGRGIDTTLPADPYGRLRALLSAAAVASGKKVTVR